MKKKVLIIEDDRDLANLFKLVLEMSGFEANTVYDGTQAMQLLMAPLFPDAILLDMHLPGISGENIYAMITARGLAHRVLICSADVQLMDEYRSRGANSLTKPVPIKDLQRMVQEIATKDR